MLSGGVDGALVGSCLLDVRADGGEGGGEVVDGLVGRGDRASDG